MLTRFIMMVVCSCFLLNTAWAASLEKIREKGSLRVAIYKDFAPYAFKKGRKVVGIEIEMGEALAKRMGVSMERMLIGADESMEDDLRNAIWKGHYLGGGTADVMFHVPVTPAFAADNDQVKIFSPYYREQLVFVYNKKRIPNLMNLAILTNHTVGVELDSMASTFLTSTLGGRLRQNVRHFLPFDEAITTLQKGGIPAVLGTQGQIEGLLAEDKVNYAISAVPRAQFKAHWDVGVAVKAEYTALAEEVEKHLNAMIADGTVEKIFQRYHVTLNKP